MTIPRSDADVRLARSAAWRVALAERGEESAAGLERWLAEDARNIAAWSSMQQVWNHFGDNAAAPELLVARQATLERANRVRRMRYRPPARVWRFHIAASVAALVTVASVGGGYLYAGSANVYRTALGERRSITLADGSHIAMDSATVLKVRLLARSRELELVQGQARFEVAHDVSRPLEVRAHDQTVVATGTNFNVNLVGGRTLVTLIQGRVAVLEAKDRNWFGFARYSRPDLLAKLVSGQQLSATSDDPRNGAASPPTVTNVNLAETSSWETGQLVFENEPLPLVVERMNRYVAHPVLVAPELAAMRVSGVFAGADTAKFLEAITRVLPVQTQYDDDGTAHLVPRKT